LENQATKTFAREATGLVRTLGFLDQFVISQAIIVLVNGFVLTFFFAPYYFPGANLALVFAVGSIPAFAMSFVYAKMSAGMPRSGGDYVWSTRILGPIYGSVQFVFLLFTTMIIGIVLSTWSNVTIAVSQLLYAFGVSTNSAGLVSFAQSLTTPGLGGTGWDLAMLLVLLDIIIAVFGLRVFAWFQRAGLALYYVSLAGFIAILVIFDPNTFPGLFNSAMSAGGSHATYNAILAQSSAAGNPSFSLTNSLLAAIPWGFLTFTGFNFGAYLAGETKNAKSAMWRSLFVSVIFTLIMLMLLSFLVYRDFNSTFINAASYVQATNGASLATLPTPSFFASLGSPAAAAFVGLSLIVGWIIVCVAYVVTISRMVFAASFDRLLPSSLANVSDRFHSPTVAVLLVGIVSWIFVTIYTIGNFYSTWLNYSMIPAVGYMMPRIAAALFPWIKKDLFQRTVGQFTSAIAVTLVSIVGIIAFATWFISQNFPILTGVYLGSNIGYAYGTFLGTIVIGLVIYGYGRWHARSMGIDLKQVYSEIPPE
jgi:basic amino acid/polyamine antiporter, APA family